MTITHIASGVYQLFQEAVKSGKWLTDAGELVFFLVLLMSAYRGMQT